MIIAIPVRRNAAQAARVDDTRQRSGEVEQAAPGYREILHLTRGQDTRPLGARGLDLRRRRFHGDGLVHGADGEHDVAERHTVIREYIHVLLFELFESGRFHGEGIVSRLYLCENKDAIY